MFFGGNDLIMENEEKETNQTKLQKRIEHLIIYNK